LVRDRIGDYIASEDRRVLEEVVIDLLKAKAQWVATAESCTGGELASRLTNVSGASAVFGQGFVTYANARKVADLGVREDTLREFGAVSHETAIEMARGALSRTGASLALSTTGVAGPSGGSDAKPVGTVYIAVAERQGSIYSRRFHFPGDRATVRSRTAHLALASARFVLLGEATRTLLWSEGEACRVERA
jgi:nicotinamide-nucleotide amidase